MRYLFDFSIRKDFVRHKLYPTEGMFWEWEVRGEGGSGGNILEQDVAGDEEIIGFGSNKDGEHEYVEEYDDEYGLGHR